MPRHTSFRASRIANSGWQPGTSHVRKQRAACCLQLAFVDALLDWVQAGGATAAAEQSAVMEEINHNAQLG